MPEQVNILISGGGTGGHIFPAIAIANGLKAGLKNPNILFVGAKGKMEMEKVPQAGYPIKGLWISGLQRKYDTANLAFPFKIISSLKGASKLIRAFKPDVAIGTGGYASGPLLFVATRKKIPTLILEQNSYPGITNKLLAKRVDKICVAYPGMETYFPAKKIIITGSPIRSEILNLKPTKEEGLKFFNLEADKPTLLIIGGSQGAHRINLSVAQNLDQIMNDNVQMIWQTGKYSLEMAQNAVSKNKFASQIKVVDFISKMDMAYTSSDLVISRAGAIAIAEIIAVKKPSIFIPLPSAAEDHQTKNAKTLVKGHAALMIEENKLDDDLAKTINHLMKREQERLIMVQNLKRFAYPDATEKIVEEVLKLIEK